MYYSPTELKRLYCRLGAKNRCSIKEANWISLIYLKSLKRAWLKTNGAKLLTCHAIVCSDERFENLLWNPLHHVRACLQENHLGHGSQESLNYYWLRMSWKPAWGLHEGYFKLQPITFSMNEKTTWNPTWQVWIMLAGIVGDFLGRNSWR